MSDEITPMELNKIIGGETGFFKGEFGLKIFPIFAALKNVNGLSWGSASIVSNASAASNGGKWQLT